MNSEKQTFFMMICLSLILFQTATVLADEYEIDDVFSQAKIIVINNDNSQTHNFDKAGDNDWVKFFGIKDQKYDIKISNVGIICDPVIELYDTDGITSLIGPISSGFEKEDEFLTWSCPKDGIFYVKVRDFNDTFGNSVIYNLQINIGLAPDNGTVEGNVKDSSGKPVREARIKTSKNVPALSEDDGNFVLKHPPGDFTLIVEAEGYQKPDPIPIKLVSGQTISSEITLMPVVEKGNINGDTQLDLIDAVLALQILVGLPKQPVVSADVDGNNRIGLEEVIYILQKISGLR